MDQPVTEDDEHKGEGAGRGKKGKIERMGGGVKVTIRQSQDRERMTERVK